MTASLRRKLLACQVYRSMKTSYTGDALSFSNLDEMLVVTQSHSILELVSNMLGFESQNEMQEITLGPSNQEHAGDRLGLFKNDGMQVSYLWPCPNMCMPNASMNCSHDSQSLMNQNSQSPALD